MALKLILVQLDNEDDAYLVFETLNTRGKDLTTSDLLKNHLARLLRATNARGDSVRVKWLTVAENVKAIQLDDVSVDDFVYHYWLAKNDFTRARDIFKVAKKTITTRPTAKKTLDELESFSHVYRDLFRGNIRAWKNEELKIKRSIESIINRFRVRQPIPLLLTALSKYNERTLSKSELERLLFAVELFTFANTGLMGARSSGGILQMYSVHARELSRSNAPSRKEKTIDVLLRKLRDRLPSKESFVERFVMLRLSDTAIADKRLIQYSLLKLMERIAPSVALDPALMSIEHIASQSSKDFDDDSISSIGNLWYLDAHFNTKLANKPSTEKLAAYQNANTPRDKYLAETDDWTPEVIKGRAIHLAELMWEIVDSSIA